MTQCNDYNPEFYVSLRADGTIIHVYNDIEEANNDTHDEIVSVGVLSTIMTDYDEIYTIVDPKEDKDASSTD